MLAIVLTVILGALLGWFLTRKKSSSDLPGPTALPLFGHLHLIGSRSLHIVLKELSDVYGSVFHLKLGSRKAVILCDREAVYEAFVKKAKDFAGRPDLPTFEYTRYGGRIGISLCDYGDLYLENRKKTVRAIHHMMADKNNLNKILTTEAAKMTTELAFFTESKKSFYPLEEFEKIVPSMFMLLMFGQDVSYDNPEFLSIISVYRKWFEAAEGDNPADFFTFLQFFPNERFSEIKKCGEAFEEFSLKMIQHHEQEQRNSNNNTKQNTLLSHLLGESDFSTEDNRKELAKVVSDLVGGGFDTSVALLSWALLYLIKQPKVLEKCRAEILCASGDKDVSMNIKDNCPYFSATIHDINRLSTVAPTGLTHTTLKDTSVKGYFIPKGTLVMPNLWQLNHDANTWERAEELHPEHFLNEQGELSRASIKEIASFSSGIRRCPASDLAFSMVFVLLGTFIKMYNFSLTKSPEDMQPTRGVVAKPKHYLVAVSNFC